MATKRKLTLKVKYETLKELEKGRPNKDVPNLFSVPGSTLATWKKNKEKTFEAFQNASLKWQRVKTGTYEKLNEALLKWLTSMCSNIPINGPILLLEEAHECTKAFNYKDFTSSRRWLRGWKERQIFSLSSICSSDQNNVGWITIFIFSLDIALLSKRSLGSQKRIVKRWLHFGRR